jgi:hypothetical protein
MRMSGVRAATQASRRRRERARHRWRVACKCNVGTPSAAGACLHTCTVPQARTLSSSLVSLSLERYFRETESPLPTEQAETAIPPRQCHVRMARGPAAALNFLKEPKRIVRCIDLYLNSQYSTACTYGENVRLATGSLALLLIAESCREHAYDGAELAVYVCYTS